jgi:hypothetical protein
MLRRRRIYKLGADAGRPAQASAVPDPRCRSTGRRNTIQCIDSTMLPRENHLFGYTRSKCSQGNVSAGLIPASDFSFCFRCEAGSSLVLRRPIETAALIGKVKFHFKSTVTRLIRHLRRSGARRTFSAISSRQLQWRRTFCLRVVQSVVCLNATHIPLRQMRHR